MLFGRLEKDRREIASLTKIMTWYTCVRLADILKLDFNGELIKIDACVTEITGTTANLQPGDKFTLNEILNALLLPSGNDAAHVLALHFGRIL